MKTTLRALAVLILAVTLSDSVSAGDPADSLAGATSKEGEPRLSEWIDQGISTVRRTAPVGHGAQAASTSFLSTDEIPEGDMPRDLAFLPDGSAVAIANRDTDTVTFFDLASQTITHTVDVGDFPVDVAVTPNGQYALVPCVFADEVYVIDIASHSVAAQVAVTGNEPYQVHVTADGLFAVVGVINDAVTSAFSVIELSSLTEIRTIPSSPQGVFGGFFNTESGAFGNIFTPFAVSPDSMTIVLPDRFNSKVELYDLTTGLGIASIATAALPTAVDISADGTLAVVNHEGNTQRLSTIDLTSSSLTSSFVTASSLNNQVIRVTPDKSHAIAAIQNATIFVNLSTGAQAASISTGTVGDIEISFDGQFAYVSNYNSRIIDIASRSLVKTITLQAANEAAASPVAHRMVALNNRFGEDVLLFDSNGASGSALGQALSGELDEGDATRSLAIGPDGNTVVSGNNLSFNGSVIDVEAGSVDGYPTGGDRPLGVAVSPDGQTAVMCNADDDSVSIVDLSTNQTVALLSVSSRPGEVVISPDSQWAYVTTVAGTDRVHFIQLNGASSSVVSSLPTGQMGSIIYTYGVISGMAVSPDGSILVVCISFDDQLMVIDTQTRTEIARLTTGDFPIRAEFGPANDYCYVTNSFGDSVNVFQINLASQTAVTTVTGIEFPLTVDVDAGGDFVYVGSFDFSNPNLRVLDAGVGHAKVKTVSLSSRPRAVHYSPQTERLYVAATDGDLIRVSAAGASSALIDSTPLSGSPSDMVFSERLRLAVSAQPGVEDGVDLVSYFDDECTGTITTFGSGCAGSGGFTPSLSLTGCMASKGQVTLSLQGGLGGSIAVLFFGTAEAALPVAGGCFLNAFPFAQGPLSFGLDGVGAGNGSATIPGSVPPTIGPATVTLQAFVLDPGVGHGYSNSNGVKAQLP